MNELYVIGFIFFLIFWVPAFISIIIKYKFQKSAEKVTGKVVEVIPKYKSSKYKFEVIINGATEYAEIHPNTAFQQYRVNEEVTLLRNKVNREIEYRVYQSLYTVPLVAIIGPLVIGLLMFSGMN